MSRFVLDMGGACPGRAERVDGLVFFAVKVIRTGIKHTQACPFLPVCPSLSVLPTARTSFHSFPDSVPGGVRCLHRLAACFVHDVCRPCARTSADNNNNSSSSSSSNNSSSI